MYFIVHNLYINRRTGRRRGEEKENANIKNIKQDNGKKRMIRWGKWDESIGMLSK